MVPWLTVELKQHKQFTSIQVKHGISTEALVGRYKHWTGLLEWNTGLTYFWFLYINVNFLRDHQGTYV